MIIEDLGMKLFSWFIKTNQDSIVKGEAEISGNIKEKANQIEEQIQTQSNNTMWPIAKVKTTLTVIKNSEVAVNKQQDLCITSSKLAGSRLVL